VNEAEFAAKFLRPDWQERRAAIENDAVSSEEEFAKKFLNPDFLEREKLRVVVDHLYNEIRLAERAKAQVAEWEREEEARFHDWLGEGIAEGLDELELYAARMWWWDESGTDKISDEIRAELPSIDELRADARARSGKPPTPAVSAPEPPQLPQLPEAAADSAPSDEYEISFARDKRGRIAAPVLLKGSAGDTWDLSFARDKGGKINGTVTVRRRESSP
jgi:hypothetical protein